jgi:hypothetical protein
MFLILAAAAAAQLSAPQPIGYPTWFSSDDVYYRVAARGASQENLVRAIVRPDGSLQGCEVEGPSKDSELDRHTCNLVRQRARYRAARWMDGTAVHGVDRINIFWHMGLRDTIKHYDTDAELIVRRRPRGVTHVAVMLAVDERGTPVSCAVEPPRLPSWPTIPPEIADLACRQILAQYRAKPALDDRRVPVRSVQIARVRLRRW